MDRYSVENYLADLQAMVRVLVEEFPQATSAQKALAECADYETFRQELDARLIDLTRHYVVVRRFWLEIKNAKIPLEELIEGANEYHPMPTLEWISAYHERVRAESGLPEEELANQINSAFDPDPSFPEPSTEPIFHVPGKHLLGCILKYMSMRTVQEFEQKLGKNLYTRLLNHVDVNEFGVFKQRLLNRHDDLAAYI